MKTGKLVAAIAALAITSVGVGSVATAAPTTSTTVSAKLTAKAEIPKQVVKNTKGTGSFSGSLTGNKLTWKLTFKSLSGAALAAHIHVGKAGTAGNVLVPLCAGATCKSGVHGTATLTAKMVKALKASGTYVNVHTQKNPNGEIRGQIAA